MRRTENLLISHQAMHDIKNYVMRLQALLYLQHGQNSESDISAITTSLQELNQLLQLFFDYQLILIGGAAALRNKRAIVLRDFYDSLRREFVSRTGEGEVEVKGELKALSKVGNRSIIFAVLLHLLWALSLKTELKHMIVRVRFNREFVIFSLQPNEIVSRSQKSAQPSAAVLTKIAMHLQIAKMLAENNAAKIRTSLHTPTATLALRWPSQHKVIKK